MEKVEFFIPSKSYRELVILKGISENPAISQEKLADLAGIVPSMANRYIAQLVSNGYLLKEGINRKNMKYRLTKNGIFRFQYLTISYLQETSKILSNSDELFKNVIETFRNQNIRECILYGAGIIGGILVDILSIYSIEIKAFIEDDANKAKELIKNIPIMNISDVKQINYDALIIASFRHMDKMLEKVVKNGLERIYHFEITDMGSISLVAKGV